MLHTITLSGQWRCTLSSAASCSQLLALHRTATLRHDELGQETLLNLLLRNHLAFNLYDQVQCKAACKTLPVQGGSTQVS